MKNLDVKSLTDKELAEKLVSLKSELFNLRFALAGRSLENTNQLQVCKRNIARVKTEMRQRELGLTKAPVATAEKKSTKKSAKVDAEVKG